jgi:two-component system sensor histidine kinase YesM
LKLYRNSLRNKLIIFLLCSIIIPISTSIIISYMYTKETVRQESIQENTKLIYQGSTNLLNYLNRINQTSLLIYSDPRAENSLYKKITESNGNELAEAQEIERNLLFIYNTIEEIHSIHLYIARVDQSFRVAYDLARNTSGQTYVPSIGQGKDIRLEHTHISHQYGFDNKYSFDNPKNVISLHRKILESPTPNILGTFSIDIKTDVIAEISEMLYTEGQEEFYILDQEGGIIYSSEPYDTGSSLQEDWTVELLSLSSTTGNYEFTNDQFMGIHVYEKLSTPYMNWTIVKRIPFEHLYQNARQLAFINSLVIVLFLIVAVAATLYISFRFTTPIKQLIRYINKIETGQLDAGLDVNRSDEIGILAKRFHQMMQKLNHLIMREYRLEIANKTNQLKTLQAQVNPHFMNNALQSIGTLALQNNDKKVYSLISSLGKMMHYNMNTNDTIVPLSKEIDHVKSYLALQQQRFNESLEFYIDVDQIARSISVPKMILQPLVENYFKHGFEPSEGTGELRITCKLVDELLEINVDDNGLGMEPLQLQTMQSQLNRPLNLIESQQSEHIGLINVLSRLKLYFNKESQITLSSNQPRGLKVKLHIPLNKGETVL